MFTFFRHACSVMLWGRRKTANKYHWHVFTVIQPHWVCPTHSLCAFPVYTAQALGCSAGNCLMLALGCMHTPGLSHSGSGSRVLLKGTDLVGPAFCACPRPSSDDQVLGEHSHPQLKAVIYRLPHPSYLAFCVYNGPTFSGVLCVSSGELISGSNPPGGCRPSRIPRNLH